MFRHGLGIYKTIVQKQKRSENIWMKRIESTILRGLFFRNYLTQPNYLCLKSDLQRPKIRL